LQISAEHLNLNLTPFCDFPVLKKYSHILFPLALSVLSLGAPAQQLYSVTGRVIENHTSEPLTGAHAVLRTHSLFWGVITDDNGYFKIENVPAGIYELSVSFMGYEKLIKEVEISAGNLSFPALKMTESSTTISTVEVKGSRSENDEPQNPMAVASARSFEIETTERYAASMSDPGRLALSFAGVRGQSDIVNGIIVRGNAPKGVLWRVEGIDVPDPNHFSQEGYGGGAVCMISGNIIGTSDFFTGAFPAQYGNAMSAVFDINLRKGDISRRHYYLQAGMLGFEGGMEGPFITGKNSSYLINYRYSTLKLFEKIGFDVGNTISTYQDLNFKFNFPASRAGTISVFGIGGMSELVNYNQRRRKTNEKTKSYDMAAVGFSHDYSLNKKNHLRSVVSVSANRETLDKDELYTGSLVVPSYRMSASNMFFRGMTELNTHISSRTSLVSGLMASGIRFKLNDVFDFTKSTGEYKNSEITYLLQGHSQVKYSLSEKWTFLAGLHLLFFGYNHHYAIEPRTGIKYQINKKNGLYLAAGLHSRLESLACYMVEDPWQATQPNRNLNFTRAAHVVLGYEVTPAEHVKVKTEFYYQYLFDVPISTDEGSYFSMLNFQARYTTMKLINDGLGKNYGIELTVEKSFSHNYYLLANGSLFSSEYYAADGVWRNTRYNTNFVTSLTGGKDFPFGKVKKSWTFGANARILWAGGERTEQSLFEEQISNYFRLDTRVSLSRKRERVTWLFAIDIQNTTNRTNENTLEDIKPTGILPVLSFRVEL